MIVIGHRITKGGIKSRCDGAGLTMEKIKPGLKRVEPRLVLRVDGVCVQISIGQLCLHSGNPFVQGGVKRLGNVELAFKLGQRAMHFGGALAVMLCAFLRRAYGLCPLREAEERFLYPLLHFLILGHVIHCISTHKCDLLIAPA